ncbi:M35 family metallo-endopeptidase [Paraburkholderia sp. EG304]|uniref:M35 family metallo-endopeptidase n=1 Tax=Paraburkholderia sp. EG304 TaxID=3237015 RepID=UPI00397946A9
MTNEFLTKNSQYFKTDENEEWTKVGTAITNAIPGSISNVVINTTPICPNMSNKEFRGLIMRLRDAALTLIKERIADVARWDMSAQDRAGIWFGRSDQYIRDKLNIGLPRLAAAMRELQPEKIIRWDEQKVVQLSCAIVPDRGTNDAAVCKPDSQRRYIAIYPHFCTLPPVAVSANCQLKVIIHECTHYVDTFNSDDVMYGFGRGVGYWAQNDPEGACRNADSIACYIAHFDTQTEFNQKKIW